MEDDATMTLMTVLTPSYAPDFELCTALHRSVLAHSPDSVRHDIVVPRRDVALFGQLAGPRARIRCVDEFIPRSMVAVPGVNAWVNVRRPFPPLRGWIMQQIIKLGAAARADADVVLLADSDVEFIRPFTPDTFIRDGVVRFYRKPDEIDQRVPRHVTWHHNSRTLLGLPAAQPPFNDYVASMIACAPSLVRELLERVETVTRRPWADAIGSQLHFSEWMLYGVFVDEVLGARANAFASDDSRCHSYWDETPLDEERLADFLTGIRPDDVAVMISAKSHTPLETRQRLLKRIALAP
jgi:hypothetical protein